MRAVDRFIELDVDAVGLPADTGSVTTVVSRLRSLWLDAVDTGGQIGLVLNLGWLVDVVTLWSGDPEQKLPIRSRRMDFLADCTYRELGELVAELRHEARAQGLPHLRVGILLLGCGEFVTEIVRAPGTGNDDTEDGALYQESGEWYGRHPELFPFDPAVTIHGPGVDWRQPMHGDERAYATRLTGVQEGESFSRFLAEQWADMCSVVGFDLLLLRDETTTPTHAGRVGFDGTTDTADHEEVDEWTAAVCAMTADIKKAAPGTWLMLYSSGLSPTVELRWGRLDVARVVREGAVDGWVDQTWGGAWQDWWDAGWQGWSFQLTNILARAALIAEGNRERDAPCRHYPLVQLLDGWEPYDTLHDYPDKLRWGIWAFTHACTDVDGAVTPPPGMYLAIANDRTPCVFHIAAGILAEDLSMHGDVGEVLSLRQSGFAFLASSTPQEAYDLALVAHLAS
ncbi:MAG: hypothetical protein WCP59_16815, partial [Actinomycetota bacterium]